MHVVWGTKGQRVAHGGTFLETVDSLDTLPAGGLDRDQVPQKIRTPRKRPESAADGGAYGPGAPAGTSSALPQAMISR